MSTSQQTRDQLIVDMLLDFFEPFRACDAHVQTVCRQMVEGINSEGLEHDAVLPVIRWWNTYYRAQPTLHKAELCEALTAMQEHHNDILNSRLENHQAVQRTLFRTQKERMRTQLRVIKGGKED